MTRDEFEEILLKYENDLYKLSLRLCNSKEDAEDLFQNTWLYAILMRKGLFLLRYQSLKISIG